MEIMKACVYCGTYRKYNNGNLGGKWLHLSNYPTRQDFYRACRVFHRDEDDPELMFQDYENIPSSMIGEGFISEEVFYVISKLSPLPEERREAFYAYCEGDGCEQDKAAVDYFLTHSISNTKRDTLIDEYISAYVQEQGPGMADYERETTACVVKLHDGGMVRFEKPTIETSFCFGYSGLSARSYEDANKMCDMAKTKDFFIERNLAEITERLSHLKKHSDRVYTRNTYIGQSKKSLLRSILIDPRESDCHSAEKVTEEDYNRIVCGLEAVKERFEKRLNAYWKRYGATKLQTWTYWADE